MNEINSEEVALSISRDLAMGNVHIPAIKTIIAPYLEEWQQKVWADTLRAIELALYIITDPFEDVDPVRPLKMKEQWERHCSTHQAHGQTDACLTADYTLCKVDGIRTQARALQNLLRPVVATT